MVESEAMRNQKETALPEGPFGDLETGNIVLQVMDTTCSRKNAVERDEYIEARLEQLSDLNESMTDGAGRAKKLIDLLEVKGRAFRHTPEYYAAIEDEKTRIKAYRDICVVSNVLSGEDAEIAENPFKFLNLPDDVTFTQTRDAYIRLSRKWFPDLIYPEDKEQYERIFGSEPNIAKIDFEVWLEEGRSLQFLSANELGELSQSEQEEYRRKHEVYLEKEEKYERVKTEMRRRATIKMQILNKAFAEAKKRFSTQEVESFGGFEWTKEKLRSLGGIVFVEYEALRLEGLGQLRKYTGRRAVNNSVFLDFDFGDKYLEYEYDFRQCLTLKAFFAWMEFRQGLGLCPALLDDISKTYGLGDDRTEQLRMMILNHEEPEFILVALGIPTSGVDHYNLLHFLSMVYDGPTYSHQVGPRDYISHSLGVEFTSSGDMVLKYESQESESSFWEGGQERVDQFGKADLQVMRAVAYGPLLQRPV